MRPPCHPALILVCAIVLGFAPVACAPVAPFGPGRGGYDLTVVHPSPRATYFQVTSGQAGGPLPTQDQLHSPAFSGFLARRTGCVRNGNFPIAPLGAPHAPAGYMVPISCP